MVLLFWEPWKLVSLQQVQPSWVQKVSYSRRKNSIFSPSFISPLYFPFPLWFITGYGVQSPALCSRTLLSAHPVYDSLCLLIPNALPSFSFTPSRMLHSQHAWGSHSASPPFLQLLFLFPQLLSSVPFFPSFPSKVLQRLITELSSRLTSGH